MRPARLAKRSFCPHLADYLTTSNECDNKQRRRDGVFCENSGHHSTSASPCSRRAMRFPQGRTEWISRKRISKTTTSCHRWKTKKRDRKSTRLNSSHTVISYAVFCLKKKTK